MSNKFKKITYWTLTTFIALIFIGSATAKLTANANTLQAIQAFGLTPQAYKILGIIEISSAILFIIPRTTLLGTFFLIAYMGGAIATHLEHAQPILIPCLIQAFLWIVAIYKSPELTKQLLNKQ